MCIDKNVASWSVGNKVANERHTFTSASSKGWKAYVRTENPKKFVSAEEYLEMADFMAGAYMTLAFDTIAKQKLAAGVHPKDGTSRPQILQKAQNPRLYNLIYEFGKITGTFALLNTSFNLHGEPVVSSESDAYRVFVLSGLDGLILDNSTVLKT